MKTPSLKNFDRGPCMLSQTSEQIRCLIYVSYTLVHLGLVMCFSGVFCTGSYDGRRMVKVCRVVTCSLVYCELSH